jgi:hypothetical protein
MINRRKLLSSAVTLAAAPLVPKVAAAAPEFDPTKQYAGLYKFQMENWPSSAPEQIRFIYEAAETMLPKGTKIITIVIPPREPDGYDVYGQDGYLGWKSIPETRREV